MKSARWIWAGLLTASATAALPLFVYGQATAPAAVAPQTVSPFVGVVSADRVYVRSGPGQSTFYEVGQLHKGDMVNVVGGANGWYQITPPGGTYALVAKEFVETDAGGATGTVKANPLNVRAGSAIYPNSDYAVIGKVAKGTRVSILGSTDKYYKIVPPAGTVLYVSPQFVQAAPAGSVYEASTVTMPGDHVTPPPVRPTPPATAPAGTGIVIRPPGSFSEVPSTAPGASPQTASTLPASTQTAATQTASTQTAATQVAGTEVVVIPPPVAPATMPVPVPVPGVPVTPPIPPIPAPIDNDAYNKFTDLNNRTQAELQKPMLDRNLAGLLKEYQDLSAGPNIPGSVKQGSAARIELLQNQIKVQELSKETSAGAGQSIEEQRKALEAQWQESKKRVDDMEKNAPPIAEGVLKTSTTLDSKYVLVNPATGRVVAYVDPASEIDLSRLLGQYIGVHGSYNQDAALGIRIIKVKTATMMAAPQNP